MIGITAEELGLYTPACDFCFLSRKSLTISASYPSFVGEAESLLLFLCVFKKILYRPSSLGYLSLSMAIVLRRRVSAPRKNSPPPPPVYRVVSPLRLLSGVSRSSGSSLFAEPIVETRSA